MVTGGFIQFSSHQNAKKMSSSVGIFALLIFCDFTEFRPRGYHMSLSTGMKWYYEKGLSNTRLLARLL